MNKLQARAARSMKPMMKWMPLLLAASLLGACGGGSSSTTTGATTSPSSTTTSTTTTSPTAQTQSLSISTSGSGSVVSSPSGIDCGSTCSAGFATDTQVLLTAQAASGYHFVGWGGACSGTGNCSVTMSSAQSVTAAFAAPTDTQLTINPTGSGSVTVTSSPASATGPVVCQSTQGSQSSCNASFAPSTSVTLAASAASGYQFAGWSGACASAGTGSCTLSMASSQTVGATFTAVAAANPVLTLNLSGTGTVTINPGAIVCSAPGCTNTFASGTSVTLSAQPGSGYTFAGWGGACSGTSTCDLTLSASQTVTGSFPAAGSTTETLTVSTTGSGTVTSTPSGISCGSTCSETVAAGTAVTLQAQPATGYSFTGWQGSCSGTATSCALTLNAAASVTANFAALPSYVLSVTTSGSGTVTSSPSGISCGSSCSSSYTSGTSVTLTAQAASGSTFSGWGGACSGTGSCTVTMSAAQSVSATFASSSSGGSGSSSCAQTSSSTVYSYDSTTKTGSNVYSYVNFGNYNVEFDDWGAQAGTLTEWINSTSCWGVSNPYTYANPSAATSPESYSNVSRGWSNNDTIMQTLSTSGYPSAPNWTTVSGLGLQVSAITKAHVKWSIATPTTLNTGDTVSRWDALIDVYFHTVANPPTSAWYPQIDLQIMQMLMDQPMSGQPAAQSGWYAYVMAASHPWTKTFTVNGVSVTYVGVIDAFGPYNASGGHTITMMPEPTMLTNSSTTSLLWGQNTVVHDLGDIIAWLSQSNPTDDSGNPIMNSSGTTVTSPVISPAYYLTSINAGFEINFGSTGNDQWSTSDFWVAVQNEADGN